MFQNERNQRLYRLFLKVAKDLNEAGIEPIAYGSLGLYLLLGEQGEISDLDLIIAKSEDFEICREVCIRHGFRIDPDHDRELEGHDTFISFLDIPNVEKYIGGKVHLATPNDQGARFSNLDAGTYLKAYRAMLKDPARRAKKKEEDTRKIAELEKFVQKHK